MAHQPPSSSSTASRTEVPRPSQQRQPPSSAPPLPAQASPFSFPSRTRNPNRPPSLDSRYFREVRQDPGGGAVVNSGPASAPVQPSEPVVPGTRSGVRRQISRAQSIRDEAKKFLGVEPMADSMEEEAWRSRRLRHICKQYGPLKTEETLRHLKGEPMTPLASGGLSPGIVPSESAVTVARSQSIDSRTRLHVVERRDSAVKTMFEGIQMIVQRGRLRSSARIEAKKTRAATSFSPALIHNLTSTLSEDDQNLTANRTNLAAQTFYATSGPSSADSRRSDLSATAPMKSIIEEEAPASPSLLFEARQPSEQASARSRRPMQLIMPKRVTEQDDEDEKARRKRESPPDEQLEVEDDRPDIGSHPHVRFLQDFDVPHLNRDADLRTQRGKLYRALPTGWPSSFTDGSIQDEEVFFDLTPTTLGRSLPGISPTADRPTPFTEATDNEPLPPIRRLGEPYEPRRRTPLSRHVQVVESSADVIHADETGPRDSRQRVPYASPARPTNLPLSPPFQAESFRQASVMVTSRRSQLSRQKKIDQPEPHGFRGPLLRKKESFSSGTGKTIKTLYGNLFSNSNRYTIIDRILRKKKPVSLDDDVVLRHPLDDRYDYRPYFTYWATFIQVMVMIVALATHGFGPFGLDMQIRTASILHSTLTLKQVEIREQGNFWIGPKFADLVHLGAKFTPCMRLDQRIFERIHEERKMENETGCCIYNDKSGCFQTSVTTCPSLIAVLHKWSPSNRGPSYDDNRNRISGAVCGQDPSACKHPSSIAPYEWPDDITQWPICTEQQIPIPDHLPHMRCELTGRPCCIQLNGLCRITTRDYCDFVNGYFHEEATLCSQVSCLGEICGMLPFVQSDRPDQFYRLFLSLFLHAGILHLIITLFIQMWFMRDLEKMIGWLRMTILYMGSGIGGNLASAIFEPYKPEVGPAASHLGLFGSLFIDLYLSWDWIEKPWRAFAKLSAFFCGLFLIGLLPWVDNWAQIAGFLFGCLIASATFPYVEPRTQQTMDRRYRWFIMCASGLAALALFVVLCIWLFVSPVYDCEWCKYFNCIPLPFYPNLCDNQGLTLTTKWLPI